MSETAAWRGKSDAWRQGWHDGFNFRAKRLKKSYTPEAKQQYKDGFKTGRDKAEGKDERISNPRPTTVAEAHAAGAADGRQGLGAVPPRDAKLKAAYMQSYRDNLVARVGIPERRKNPRVRRKSNRRPGPALVVLYASRPGSRRLKYLGRGKFGERGRPMLFKTAEHARIAAGILRDTYPAVLRRWTLKAGT